MSQGSRVLLSLNAAKCISVTEDHSLYYLNAYSMWGTSLSRQLILMLLAIVSTKGKENVQIYLSDTHYKNA